MKVTKSIEVRYAETDLMGIVHHASYIVWFEIGRVAMLNAFEIGLNEVEKRGFFVPVLDVYAKYHVPI
ncbi:MAG: acyl-CoA thioesterase, partial [Bacilli bacterium]